MLDLFPAYIFFIFKKIVEVSGEHIGFDIDSAAHSVAAKECFFKSYGYDGEAKVILKNLVDRQTHAIYGDTAFGDDESDILFWYTDKKVGGVATGNYFCDGAHAVDVALEDMSLDPIAKAHGRLYMDRAFVVFDGYDPFCFISQLHFKTIFIHFRDTQAGSVDGDGVSDVWFVLCYEAKFLSIEMGGVCDLFDKSSKHILP